MKQKFIYYFVILLLLFYSCSEPIERSREIKIDPTFWNYEGSDKLIEIGVKDIKSTRTSNRFEKYATSLGKPLWEKAHYSFGVGGKVIMIIPIVDAKKKYTTALVFLQYETFASFKYTTVVRKGLMKDKSKTGFEKASLKTYFAAWNKELFNTGKSLGFKKNPRKAKSSLRTTEWVEVCWEVCPEDDEDNNQTPPPTGGDGDCPNGCGHPVRIMTDCEEVCEDFWIDDELPGEGDEGNEGDDDGGWGDGGSGGGDSGGGIDGGSGNSGGSGNGGGPGDDGGSTTTFIFTNPAFPCNYYAWQTTGTAFTTEIAGLGFSAKSNPWNLLMVELGNVCVTMPTFHVETQNNASRKFNKVYKESILQVMDELDNGLLTPENHYGVRTRLVELIKFNLNDDYPGSKFTTGGCLGNVPINTAKYFCN